MVTGGIIGLELRGFGLSPPGETFGGSLMAGVAVAVTRGINPDPFVIGGTNSGVGFAEVTGGICKSSSVSSDESK